MWLGERPTDNVPLDKASSRPTSYQPALVACHLPLTATSRRHGQRATADHHWSQTDHHRATETSASATINHLDRLYILINVLALYHQLLQLTD